MGCLWLTANVLKSYKKKYSNLTNPNLLKNITLIKYTLITVKVAIYGRLLVLVCF